MSWEDAWPLVTWPTGGQLARAIAEIAELAELEPPGVTHAVVGTVETIDGLGADATDALPANSAITVVFRVPVDEAVEVARRLDPDATAESIEEDLDPPRGTLDWESAERAGVMELSAGGDPLIRSIAPEHAERFTIRPAFYRLAVDLVSDDDEPPRVNIYSNEYDNREGYPVLVHLAAALAERLGEAAGGLGPFRPAADDELLN